MSKEGGYEVLRDLLEEMHGPTFAREAMRLLAQINGNRGVVASLSDLLHSLMMSCHFTPHAFRIRMGNVRPYNALWPMAFEIDARIEVEGPLPSRPYLRHPRIQINDQSDDQGGA